MDGFIISVLWRSARCFELDMSPALPQSEAAIPLTTGTPAGPFACVETIVRPAGPCRTHCTSCAGMPTPRWPRTSLGPRPMIHSWRAARRGHIPVCPCPARPALLLLGPGEEGLPDDRPFSADECQGPVAGLAAVGAACADCRVLGIPGRDLSGARAGSVGARRRPRPFPAACGLVLTLEPGDSHRLPGVYVRIPLRRRGLAQPGQDLRLFYAGQAAGRFSAAWSGDARGARGHGGRLLRGTPGPGPWTEREALHGQSPASVFAPVLDLCGGSCQQLPVHHQDRRAQFGHPVGKTNHHL